jgi:hypothetical protein
MNNIDKYIPNEDEENISDITDDDSDDEETRQIVYNALLRNMNKHNDISNITINANEENLSTINKKKVNKICNNSKFNSTVIECNVKTNKRQFQPRKPPYNLIKSNNINKNNFELNNNDFPSL